MLKRRGWPDQRGMGAESDFLSEPFIPDERFKAQQRAIAETLIKAGLNPAELGNLSPDEDTVKEAAVPLPTKSPKN